MDEVPHRSRQFAFLKPRGFRCENVTRRFLSKPILCWRKDNPFAICGGLPKLLTDDGSIMPGKIEVRVLHKPPQRGQQGRMVCVVGPEEISVPFFVEGKFLNLIAQCLNLQ